ncbi:hypothetical protein, partial [uncultured Eubacterium sp.]|uniref:hypothetical protein n=1 Tax=uncultured Eubacterium sp. TaxID=165185 RepID=UPI00259299E6
PQFSAHPGLSDRLSAFPPTPDFLTVHSFPPVFLAALPPKTTEVQKKTWKKPCSVRRQSV